MNTAPQIDDEDDYDDFIGDDDWEDQQEITAIRAKYPEDWHLVKVVNFSYGSMADMKQWCTDNCNDEYAHVGWYSGCSYTVGVIFESHFDAILFKLTWSGV